MNSPDSDSSRIGGKTDDPDAALTFDGIRSCFGLMCLMSAAALAALTYADRVLDVTGFPPVWYTTRQFHVLLIAGIALYGFFILKSRRMTDHAAPTTPVFESVRVFVGKDCPLCDKAIATLQPYLSVLPEPEIIDISEIPELQEKYSNCIPVVEMNGRVRFRGIVNPGLLERLIENRCRQATAGMTRDRTASEHA